MATLAEIFQKSQKAATLSPAKCAALNRLGYSGQALKDAGCTGQKSLSDLWSDTVGDIALKVKEIVDGPPVVVIKSAPPAVSPWSSPRRLAAHGVESAGVTYQRQLAGFTGFSDDQRASLSKFYSPEQIAAAEQQQLARGARVRAEEQTIGAIRGLSSLMPGRLPECDQAKARFEQTVKAAKNAAQTKVKAAAPKWRPSMALKQASFEELDAQRAAVEEGRRIDRLTDDYRMLIDGILMDPEIDDKPGAINKLTAEFSARVGGAMKAKAADTSLLDLWHSMVG